MNIRINSNFKFHIAKIDYNSSGEICISITSADSQIAEQCRYSAIVSDGSVETKKSVSLLAFARRHEHRTDISPKTQSCYRPR